MSTLRLSAPLILVNVCLGDSGVLADRACGCPLERLGWVRHLSAIRSYQKLTGLGMTFLDTDVIRILEEVLPGRFGGGPTDYQLLEEETDDGRSRLRLLVRPEVGPVDPDAVAGAFLDAIGIGSGSTKVMGLVWKDVRLVEVERQAPVATAAGKILHLRVEPRPQELGEGLRPPSEPPPRGRLRRRSRRSK